MASRYKNSKKNYFTQDTEDAIIEYNNTQDYNQKSRIYGSRIHNAFFKLTQNIIHTFKFYHTEVEDLEHLQHEIIIFLLSKIHLYNHAQNIQDRLTKIIVKEFKEEYNGDFVEYVNNATKITQQQINDFILLLEPQLSKECFQKLTKLTVPKAYSYFGTITKRWLITYNEKNYKNKIYNQPIDDFPTHELFSYDIESPDYSTKNYLYEYFDYFIDYIENNFDNLYKKEDDKKIADAVLEILRKRENIDIFHKKAVYEEIREILYISGLTKIKSPKITKVIKNLHNIFEENYIKYVNTDETPFIDID